MNIADRAAGAVIGALVGDALGLARSRGFGGYVNRKSFKINPSA